jgi:hypothetical protein
VNEHKQIATDPVSEDRPLDLTDEPVVNSAGAAETGSIVAPDYHSWLVEQAALIRARKYQQIDWDNVAEELEDMASSVRRATRSDLEILLQHLLKLQYEPSANEWRGRSRGWKLSVVEHRNRIVDILEDSGSLRKMLPEMMPKAYSRAVEAASIDTSRRKEEFPGECPWSIQEIMEMDFPDPFGLGRG